MTPLKRIEWRRIPWALIALLASGAALRMARLDNLPPALFRDEAEKAYTAWSLLRTGRTLDGAHLPLFVNVFGVTTSAIYQYCAVPFIWMFGPNEWGARLPAAVAGTLTILMNYLYMRRERGRDAAVWAAAFLVMSPWHIIFSRWAQQGILVPLFVVSGMWAWRAFLDGRKWGLPVAGACFGMAIYSYDVAKLFVPLLLLWIALLYAKDLARRWKETLLGAAAFAAIVAPVVRLSLSAPDAAQARFNAISILQPGIGPAAVIGEFLRNYFLHFSPQFLLLFGDGELRHSAGVGMLTVVEFACAILWAHYAWKRRWKREDLVWLGWLLLSPVAASLTRVGIPHALRMIVVIPVIQNMAGEALWQWISRRTGIFAGAIRQTSILAIIIGFVPFACVYFIMYTAKSAANWQYGVKQALTQLEPDMGRIDTVAFHKITGAEYLVSYYAQIPPEQVMRSGLRETKFRILPFNQPDASIYSQADGAAAYVTYPFVPPPPGGKMIEIAPPRTTRPVAVIYLNKELWDRIGASVTGRREP